MEQLERQNGKERNMGRLLGAENTLLHSKERKREGNIIKDLKNLF